ncbi:lipase family protein [Pseudanabaena sp. UWO311]|uniref:lipase family protein n=1 Tax=Pseudanabaena sp. UWO311 TaxID=2487337 RepID=UPI00115A3255|nr:lipase family protein [Pseudanabaena sp. UWO311]TYQ28389.1 lipase family protein [Pseudanabaena sp. UWO311]
MNNVEPYKTTLSRANAYWMARIAGAAYIKMGDKDYAPNEAAILKDLKDEDPKFLSVLGVSENSAQAVLIEHEDYFCLAFRGTDEKTDWLDNLNMFPERALFGEFHRGFWNSVGDVWEPLYDRYISLRKEKRRPIFLTGHSLGGAMATVAAARFIQMDSPFVSTYTFGQPRAMTLETSRIFNQSAMNRCFRFQNNNDIVTRMPARIMSYSHVGTYLYISEEETIYNDPGFWFRFIDSVEGSFESFAQLGRLDALSDHRMELYLNAVKKWDCAF